MLDESISLKPRFGFSHVELGPPSDVGMRHPFSHSSLDPSNAAREVFGETVLISPAIRLATGRTLRRRDRHWHAPRASSPSDAVGQGWAGSGEAPRPPAKERSGFGGCDRRAARRVGIGHGSHCLLCLRQPVALHRGGLAVSGSRFERRESPLVADNSTRNLTRPQVVRGIEAAI